MPDYRTSPAFVTGVVLVLSGVGHGIPFLLGDWPWEALVSWRKPILFGISTGLTCMSLAWVYARVRHRRLLDGLLAALALVEVAAITTLTWLGEPSHFGGQPEWLLATVHGTALGLTALIGWTTVVVLGPAFAPKSSLDQRLAVRSGMVFLFVSCVLGAWTLVHGILQLDAGLVPDRYGDAGVPKFAHGITIHALQLLVLTAWGLERIRVPPVRRMRIIAAMSAGQAFLLVFALVQVLSGRGRLDIGIVSAVLLFCAAALTATPLMGVRPKFQE